MTGGVGVGYRQRCDNALLQHEVQRRCRGGEEVSKQLSEVTPQLGMKGCWTACAVFNLVAS